MLQAHPNHESHTMCFRESPLWGSTCFSLTVLVCKSSLYASMSTQRHLPNELQNGKALSAGESQKQQNGTRCFQRTAHGVELFELQLFPTALHTYNAEGLTTTLISLPTPWQQQRC